YLGLDYPVGDIITRETTNFEFKPLDDLPVLSPNFFKWVQTQFNLNDTALGNAYPLEIGRGCETGCRFCLLSHHQRPPRFRSFKKIRAIIDELKNKFDKLKITIVGSNTSDHPDLPRICSYILDRGFTFSLPSVKPNISPEILELMERSNIHSITLAPETGSYQLRKSINKNLSNEDFMMMTEKLIDHGVSNVKTYLIFGLPFENETDNKNTIDFITTLKNTCVNKGANLSLSVNMFIPKLGTPFMFHTKNFTAKCFKTFKRKYKELSNRIKKTCAITLKQMNPEMAKIQAALSIGGIEINKFILKTINHYPESIKSAIPENVLDAHFNRIAGLLYHEPATHEYILNLFPEKLEFLKNEWLNAKNAIISPPCNDVSCQGCGKAYCSRKITSNDAASDF
ncbi:MAG: B12-binding domain-containing radical SAM protein, partial [Promethearchaeota archaeon]